MLDSVTKKRIDDLRQILVGKITNPQSQVEQITTGLIYKFMYDMDNEAIEMGGVPSFFIDEFEKYSWKHLFNPKLGGVEKVRLYGDAIENLYNNPNAPQIFREIFKNSFLPFKEPSTLNMFLKEINEFHYSNSEQLGDAYEYLLSFMGSQGKAGQFRTPRHIIDFIIKIVNPQKNETILDPACGTSGFLISSYKHILTQNTQTRLGDKLNASERKQIGENLVGYDIDPSMSRISLVNMYLHNFASPNISEYDTLSSEDKWNEYFDVILANPPFFSPTGGIKPHSRFGVKSTRAEVLFVDYIMEHLKPKGRAGIIVPEGIIFQTGKAYKSLRKKLVDNYLVGVISLPQGVFQPYSGVKTSILILDKEINQKTKKIYFANVENDGFSLGAQRIPIDKSDLPEIISSLSNQESLDKISHISVEEISRQNFDLSAGKYVKSNVNHSKYEMLRIREVCEIAPKKSLVKHLNSDTKVSFVPMEDLREDNSFFEPIKVRKIGDVYSGYTYFADKDVIVAKVTPCFENKKSGIAQKLINGIGFGSSEFIPIRCGGEIIPEYLYQFISEDKFIKKGIENFRGTSGLRRVSKEFISDYQVPVPSIEIQQKIVQEIDGYQKIIDGCQQVIANYKPSINFDQSWEFVELGNLVSINNGNTLTVFDTEGDLAAIKVSDMNLDENQVEIVTSNKRVNHEKYNQKNILSTGSIIFPKRGAAIATNKKRITKIPCVIDNNCMGLTVKSKRLLAEYLFSFLCGFDLTTISKSAGIPLINNPDICGVKIPLPSVEVQHLIIENIQNEKYLIEGNKKLIKIYKEKKQNKIRQLWENDL